MVLGNVALGFWVFASIPLGLLLGWACGLNKLSPRGREVPLDDHGYQIATRGWSGGFPNKNGPALARRERA